MLILGRLVITSTSQVSVIMAGPRFLFRVTEPAGVLSAFCLAVDPCQIGPIVLSTSDHTLFPFRAMSLHLWNALTSSTTLKRP